MTAHSSKAQASPRFQENHAKEQIFLERAQSGEDVRNEAVLYLQPAIERMAYRLNTRLSPQSRILKSIEQCDLVQEANVRMLAQFSKALSQKEPFRWLMGVGYGAMRDKLNGRGDPIKRLHSREKPIPIIRLDRTLTNDGCTLADILPDDLHTQRKIPNHVLIAIEQAIDALPSKQRLVIDRYFGFHEHAPIPLNEISRDLATVSSSRRHSNASYHYKRAIAALRQSLSEVFPQYTGGTQQ